MSSEKKQTPKEKYNEFLKEIRTQKSLPVLEKIYEDLKANREHLYDNNIVPFEFSDDFVWFLKYNLISVQYHMDIFKLYIEEFFNMRCKPENLIKQKFLYDIFTYDSNFYSKASNTDNFLVFINRFFNIYYPKDNTIKHNEGDIMDVLVNEERNKLTLQGWIQLKIKRIDKEKNLYIFNDYKDNNKEIMIGFDNYKAQEKNTFVTEDEMNWRNNLKEGDKLDFLNTNKYWIEATVKEIINDTEIGISTREREGVTLIMNKYSPFVQPYLKYSFKFQEDEATCIALLEDNYEFQRFNYMVPFNEKNHCIPQEGFKYYSLEYYELLNLFINKVIETKILLNESTSIEYIYVILNILCSASCVINQIFLGEYIRLNVFENVRKILMNFSLDKKTNKSKMVLDNIITFLDKFLGYSQYPFQLCKILPEFIIEFGYNCFKNSESLEKRLLGLNCISKMLPLLNRFFPIISNEVTTKITTLISDKLLGSDSNNDLFGLLFLNPNIHEQLLLKGVDVIIHLTQLKLLDDKDIERLYNLALSSPLDSDIYKALYDLLNKITSDIDISQLKVLFDKIISFPYDKIRENDLALMSNVLQHVKIDTIFKDMAKTYLDYYYNFIVDFKKMDSNYGPKFADILTFTKDDENIKYLYTYYFEKVVNDLIAQNDLIGYRFFFTFISNLFNSLKQRNEKEFGCLPYLKMKFREIFLNKIKNMEAISDKLMELYETYKKDNYEEEFIESNISDVIDILQGLINFIEENNFYTLNSMKKLCEYFVFSEVPRKYRGHFLFNISEFKRNGFDLDKFLEYLFHRFDQFLDSLTRDKPERFKLLDNVLAMNMFSLFMDYNNPKESELGFNSETPDSYTQLLEYKYKSKLNPLEFKYVDIIWKMFSKCDNMREPKKFLENFTLKNYTPKERHEIWEQLVKKIFEIIDDNILTSLNMIDFIIEISEKFGNGGAISHSIESKKKIPIKLNFMNSIVENGFSLNFSDEEQFYSTDNIYKIKSRIQKKYGIDPIFLDIVTTKSGLNSTMVTPDYKFLYQLYQVEQKPNQSFEIYARRSKLFNRCPLYPIIHQKEFNPKFLQILQEIFYKNAKGNILELNQFKRLFPNLFENEIGDIKKEESIKDFVENYYQIITNNKTVITFDEFSQLVSSLSGSGNKFKLFIFNCGYSPNLDYFLSPLTEESPLYYQENNVKEYMPRYFIGNNQNYMNKIFNFAKYDNKDIQEKAQHLLQELCTMEELKKTIFEKSDKIGEIISNKNLELRGYGFDILLTEFEKEDKDENTKILVDNFIKNNLNKVIVELEKFSNSNEIKDEKNDDNTNIMRYFNFYNTNLKILFYTFKNIIDNNEMIECINKFDDLEDDNKKNNLKEMKIELSKEKLNLIQSFKLSGLINTIGNNLKIISENTNTEYRKATRLTVKLLIYIIVFSKDLPEEEKIPIYKNYINNEISYIKLGNFYTKRLFFTANKLLLNYMNNEINNKFVLTIFDILSEEFLDYETLNNHDGRLSILFKIFIDLLEISIKNTKNESIFTFYEKLMKIISDKNIELKQNILTGYIHIMKEILTILKTSEYPKLYEYDFESLINKIINEFIITSDKDQNDNINEINNLKNYSKYSDTDYVSFLFQILGIIISLNPEKYLKIFFLNDDIKDLREKHLTKFELTTTGYKPDVDSRSSNSYIGLKNLSSICYMNSVLQQFFMIPLFRYTILSLPLPKDFPEEKEDNDNLLFQLIRMFYYLNYSDKGDYNPKHFVYSFKDYEGNPTKINVQCDAQEFLSRFIEKVEECVKNDKNKYLCNNIFGGTTLQQVKCTNPDCGNISERKENINYLSLDIKDVQSVEQCLDKYIIEEKIEDYHCEKCDKKITNIKNVLIDKIPNILIIHLQRIAFSYETFNMEKINKYITFEKTLNIKKYTVNKDNEDMPIEYFDYDLQGILIHSGTAQFGHYYSFISKEGNDNPDDWIKFNDSSVTKVKYDNISWDAFGNNSDHQYGSSAYMLIYKKSVKKPVIINAKEIDEDIKKILEEKKEEKLESIEMEKGKIYYIYENEKDAIEKNTDVNKLANEENNINKNIIIKNTSVKANLVSYKEALDLLIKENNENKDKKPFLKNILLENVRICNDKKFYTKSFSTFIKEETELLKEEIIKDKTGQKINEYLPIIKTINNYILFILPFSCYLDYLEDIIKNIIDIYNHSIPKEFLSSLIKDIIEPNQDNLYKNYYISRDNKKGRCMSIYISKILCCCINNNIEIELVNKIIQFYLDKIPVEITHNWVDMEAFNKLILVLVQDSDIIKKSFINNGIIAKLIDYIMGKDSPLYQGDERIDNKNSKGKFGYIVKAITYLLKYYLKNWEKDGLKLSKGDLLMINCIKFYEKIILEDYNSEASSMLIDYKMNLMILNKEENKEDFDKEIIDIIIKLKIPSIKKKEEIISGLNLITHIIQKYAKLYKIDEIKEEGNNIENTNKEQFLEKLNILIGVPIPTVISGESEIKYISGRYSEKYTILSNIFSQKEKNKEALPLIKAIFNLFNINKTVFDYIDKLPAPNSFKYSFVDYCLKLYTLIQKELEAESNVMDEMEMNNPYKEYDNIVNEMCSKYNKDITLIKFNDAICIDNSIYFPEFYCEKIKEVKYPNQVSVFQLKLFYVVGKTINKKTELSCFTQSTFFKDLVGKSCQDDNLMISENEIHVMQCIVIHSNEDLDITINLKPYFYSKMEIEAKKEFHYFIYCVDVDDNFINENIEIYKILKFDNMKIEVSERKLLALPAGNNNVVGSEESCSVNCPVCGNVNILNDGNPEFKCVYCESPLF